MDAARWQRIEYLCAEALELPAEGREDWLRSQCQEDEALAQEVTRLVATLESDPGFLERPLFDPSDISPDPPEPPALPEQIGPYRVQRRLGHGGMGEVYLAEREADGIRQVVAIKVVRLGMGSQEILERFRQERRILAGLDHPHIARLLDAGVTHDGRPYFVMEAVEGVPVDRHCDEHRLGVSERVTLFRTICDAVQHAHQRMVVHRDLKPGNILVSQAGVVKLLDFGIGKVLDAHPGSAPQTRQQVRLLTPEYAAPEQLDGGTISTATDVYSLGVLLHELLVGRHPSVVPGQSRQETERQIREVRPRRPSTLVTGGGDTDPDPRTVAERRGTSPARLRRQLAGDLDTIVLMALRKEADRRYQSAAALAEDLRRWQEGRTVRARPDTLGYRTGTFLRRNAGWSAAAATLLLGLLATTSVTIVQARRVRQESARVAAERDKALEVRGFLMEMFGASGAGQNVGDTVTVRGLLDLQAGNVETMYRERPELMAEMLEVLADGYDRLGLLSSADSLATRALALRRDLHPDGDPDLASAVNLAGWIAHQRGRPEDAERLLNEAIGIRRAGGPAQREGLARSLNDLGVALNAQRRYPEAEAVLREAQAIRLAELGPGHRAVGITGNNLAAALYFQGRLPEAVDAQQVAVSAIEAALGPEHQRTVVARSNLAAMRRAAGDRDGAIEDFRALVALQARIQGTGHPVTARTRNQLANALADRGLAGDTAAMTEARHEHQLALTALEAALGPRHPDVGTTLSALALVHTELGDHRAALAAALRASDILRNRPGGPHPAAALAQNRAAQAHWRLGERDAAVGTQRQAVAGLLSESPTRAAQLGRARLVLCEYLLARDEAGDARDAGTECLAALESLAEAPGAPSRTATMAALRLAQAHRRSGQQASADSIVAAVRAALGDSAATGTIGSLLDSLERGPRG